MTFNLVVPTGHRTRTRSRCPTTAQPHVTSRRYQPENLLAQLTRFSPPQRGLRVLRWSSRASRRSARPARALVPAPVRGSASVDGAARSSGSRPRCAGTPRAAARPAAAPSPARGALCPRLGLCSSGSTYRCRTKSPLGRREPEHATVFLGDPDLVIGQEHVPDEGARLVLGVQRGEVGHPGPRGKEHVPHGLGVAGFDRPDPHGGRLSRMSRSDLAGRGQASPMRRCKIRPQGVAGGD